MQREGDLPIHRHLPHRGRPRRIQPGIRHAISPRLGNHLGVVRVQEQIQLRLIQILRIRRIGRFLNAVGVIQQHAEIADAADAGFRTYRRLAGFDPREAEDAFLRLAARPVVVNLLVRAAGHAHPPAPAFVLIDQHNAVLFPLINRAGWAHRGTGRVEAMFAQTRQIHHEGVFELTVNLLLHVLEIGVLRSLGELTTEDFLPVRAPFDLFHPLAGNGRTRPRGREGPAFGCGLQMRMIDGEGFVVVIDFRQVRIGEDVGQHAPFGAHARLQLATRAAHPAAVPLGLIFPLARVADARLGFHVVEPGVFHPFPRGPNVLAGDRTGMAADALVQVQHHADLRADFHWPTPSAIFVNGPSSQSTLAIFRTTMNSSRLAPTVP